MDDQLIKIISFQRLETEELHFEIGDQKRFP